MIYIWMNLFILDCLWQRVLDGSACVHESIGNAFMGSTPETRFFSIGNIK